MGELTLIIDYKDNDTYRKSFNALAENTFGIQFQDWYQHGFWNERYIPYSFIDGDQVVANVSVNLLNLVISGETINTLQFGTVMTHPDYRNQGLSARLMSKIFEDNDKTCDFMYLFANQTVLSFYPKFGFHPYKEHLFEIQISENKEAKSVGRILNPNSTDDRRFIYEFVKKRVPVSKLFGVMNSEDVFMFHTMYGLGDSIYYFAKEEIIVIFQIEDDAMYLFDVISNGELSLKTIIPKIVPNKVRKVIFYFTPDFIIQDAKAIPYEANEVLFVRNKSRISLPKYFKHPITSQA